MFLLLVTSTSPKPLFTFQPTAAPALPTIIHTDHITSANEGTDITVSDHDDLTPTPHDLITAGYAILEESTHTTDWATNNHGFVGGYNGEAMTYPSSGVQVPKSSEMANREAQLPATYVYTNSNPDYGIHAISLAPDAVTESRRVIHPLINSMAIPDGEKPILQMILAGARFKANDALESYVSRKH